MQKALEIVSNPGGGGIVPERDRDSSKDISKPKGWRYTRNKSMYVCNHRTKGCKTTRRTPKTDLRRKGEFAIILQFKGALRNAAPCSLLGLPVQKQGRGRWMCGVAGLQPGASFLESHSLFSPLAYLQTPEKMERLRSFLNTASQKLLLCDSCFSLDFAIKGHCVFLNSRQSVLF